VLCVFVLARATVVPVGRLLSLAARLRTLTILVVPSLWLLVPVRVSPEVLAVLLQYRLALGLAVAGVQFG